jgi:hypothetical protein
MRTGYGEMKVIHETPPVWSDQRVHILDENHCWCNPIWEVVEGILWIRHQDEFKVEVQRWLARYREARKGGECGS